MATNINWFVIWVPSREAENTERQKTRSRSKTPYSEDVVGEKGDTGRQFEITKIQEEGEEEAIDGKKTIGVVDDKNVPENGSKFAVTKVEEENVTTTTSDDSVSAKGDITDSNQLAGTDDKSDNREKSPLIEETVIKEKPSEMTVKSDAFLEWESLEDIVTRVIAQREISSLHIVSSTDKMQTQFSFFVPFDVVEDLILELQNNGLGQLDNTSLSVFPSSIHVSEDTRAKPEKTESVIEDKMDKFYSSIKSRLVPKHIFIYNLSVSAIDCSCLRS